MIPALGMVILPQNTSTENRHVPGWSCILSVGNGGKLIPSIVLCPKRSNLCDHGDNGVIMFIFDQTI